ncbi:MAG TPA: hypothetical protein VJH34_03165 [archaeon]|nr:hypothetical protein [archaeon]
MKPGQLSSKTIENVARVAKFIELNPDTHLREIARELKLHPYVVERCLKDMSEFIVYRSVNEQLGGEGLPNLPIYIKLKEGVTAEGIVRFLMVRNKIKEG